MNFKLLLFLAAILCAGAVQPTSAQAQVGIHVEIGDRPYYRYGPSYWRGGVRYYWVPGHWAYRYRYHHRYRVWIHGHYAPRRWY